jgi:hypothetical protein
MGVAEGSAVGLADDNIAAGAVVGGGIGSVAEMALPPALRGAGRLIKKLVAKSDDAVRVTGGSLQPTEKLKKALGELGLKFDDIKGVDLTDLPENMTPEQMARAILFEKNKIPTLRSRVTQDAGDFADQIRIERMTGDEGADIVRQRISEESAAIQNQLKGLADDLGISDQAGDSVKRALDNLDSGQAQKIRNAYDDLLKMTTTTNADAMPLPKNHIREAVDDVLFGTKPVNDETRTAIKRAAARFGILGDDVTEKGSYSIIDFDGEKIQINGKQTPLNMGNFEEFRKTLNQAFQRDTTGSVTAIKKAVDDTVINATNLLEEAADEKAFIRSAAERARQTVIGRKELLDTGSLVPRLLNDNPATGSPFVEASKVTDKIFSQATPSEEVGRLMTALNESNGKRAIDNLQADTVMRLVNKAFKNAGKLEGGQTPFNITAFTNEMRSIGDSKLDLIFKDNKPALKALREFEQIGQLMRTPSSATQKGSAPDMVNAIIRASRLTAGMGGDVTSMAAASVAGRQYTAMNNRTVRKKLIEMTGLNEKEAVNFMTQTYPDLAAVLGITAYGTQEVIDDGR